VKLLVSMGALVGLAVLLASGRATAGDAPAHSAAMLKAAKSVAEQPEFASGVGGPEFQILEPKVEGIKKLASGVTNSTDDDHCWSCSLKSASCPKSCALGAAVNAPDLWACDDAKQPPKLSYMNTQASPRQTRAIGPFGDVPEVAMACNYTHFAFNTSPSGLDAGDVQQIVLDWADEIPKAIETFGGSGAYACDKASFDEYLGRVANALHYAQDAASEHHQSGGIHCSTNDEMVPLIVAGSVLDLFEANYCRFWIKDELERVRETPICDAEVVTPKNELSFQLKIANDLCDLGFPLACTGLERTLRHHCDLDGAKSINCQGPKTDHREIEPGANKPNAYCEGERFPGGGQDFVTKAAAASEGLLEGAMQRWAEVCEPPDPCKLEACNEHCSRRKEHHFGYCVTDKPEIECEPLACKCAEECGAIGTPCCDADKPCGTKGQCSKASGYCVSLDAPVTQCSDGGSSGNGGTGGSGPDGGMGEGGAAGSPDDGAGGASGGMGATSGAGGSGPVGVDLTPPNPGNAGIYWGEPHLVTFDGLLFDLQAVGELTAALDPSDDFEVQIRTVPVPNSKTLAVVSATAARVGADRVVIYWDRPSTLNGVETTFDADGTTLSGGGAVYRVGAEHIIRWPDGSQLRVGTRWVFLNIALYLSDERREKVSGVLGNFDSSFDELFTRGGAAVPSPVDFETFYGVFAESWRIEQSDSLFDYGPAETTETYTDRAFPYRLLRYQDLDPTDVEEATVLCEGNGVTDPDWLKTCAYDVAATGDPAYASEYTGLPAPKEVLEVLPPLLPDADHGGALGGGSAVSGTLTPDGQYFFTFAANAGEGIQLRLADIDGGPFVPSLSVYNAAGGLVASAYGGEVAYASFQTPGSGTFTVLVSDISGLPDLTADFELYFTHAPGSNEGGLLSASDAVSGTIDKGDLDSYTFDANAGEGIQLRLTDLDGGAFVPALAVYNPAGGLVSAVYGNEVAYTSFAAVTTGTYTVVAYDWSPGVASTGNYTLYFTVAPGANEGGLLSASDPVTGTIDKGDLDSYTFDANAGEGVQLRLTDVDGGAFVPALAVYNPAGGLVSAVYGNEVAYTSFAAVTTGTYTVVAYDWSTGVASTGNYALYFTVAPGANEGGLLSASDAVSGTIDKGDLDSYTFDANAGEGIQLRLTDVDGGAFVPALAVYNPAGGLVSAVYGNEVAYTSFAAVTTGTYTVVAYDWSTGVASTGNYTLYFTAAPGANEGGSLSPGSVTAGTIDKGDLDSYTFTANAGEGIQLRLTDVAGGAFVPALAVYNPAGGLVSAVYGVEVANTSFAAVTTGTYTVVAYDWSTGVASTGDYDLHFTKAPGANEGGALVSGTPVSGAIGKGDLDSYTFTANAGDTIQLSMSDIADTAFVPALAVYNPAGGFVSSVYAAGVATSAFTAGWTGTYTVVAYDWSSGAASTGDYTLVCTVTP
jgi:hypothetical protein